MDDDVVDADAHRRDPARPPAFAALDRRRRATSSAARGPRRRRV
jgi:hypothetical protein